jgi:hypothetical protein
VIGELIEARHYVDGEWSADGATFESRASADGELVCRAPVADPLEVHQQPVTVPARRPHDESAPVLVHQARAGGEAAGVVRDRDDVDLSEDPVGLSDGTRQELPGSVAQSTTSTETERPSR